MAGKEVQDCSVSGVEAIENEFKSANRALLY